MNAKEFKVSKLSIQALKAVQTEAVEWSEKENASPSAEKAPYTLVPIRGANWTECDPAVNYPYIACYACRDLQAVAAGLETVQDVSGLPFVVNEVMELTDAKKADLGKVVNGRKAVINGLRLTMGHPSRDRRGNR